MELKNHCLFCLERIMPFILFPSIGDEEDVGLSPDFQSLCTYLKISLPKKENTESVLSSSCDELLCVSCFEMVDQLKKLHRGGAPPEVGKRIGEVSRRIREVILAHDISADLPSSKRRKLEFEKELGSGGIGRRDREDNDCLTFVEMFQTLVKGVDLEGIGENSLEELTETKLFSSAFKKISSHCDNPEINEEIDEVEMNNELGEAELGSIDEAEDPLAEFYSDKEDSDSPYDPSDTSSMESEWETSDGEDLKPDIMTQPTDKKMKSQSSNETNSIPGRTKMLLRKRNPSPEPSSIKPSSKKKLKEDKPISQFKCSECDLSFASYSQRAKHRRESHPRKSSTFQRLVALIPQAPTTNPGLRHCRRICTICGEHVIENNPRTILTYMEHMLSHDEDEQSNSEATGPYSCTKCDKQFNLKINLDLHIACIHDARLLIRCHLCREKMNHGTREQLIEHLKSMHGDTVYSCKHCPMSFISFEKLLHHMKRRHRASKRLLCPECDGVYTTVRELYEHCLEVHPQLWGKYNCERCEKSYLQSYRLRTHLETKHGFDWKSKTFKEELAVGGNFSCPHCESKGKVKMYKTESALRFHISNVHTKRRNHKCDQCENKFFESRSGLRKHVESVHERIRYPCHICPKAYAEKLTLNNHLKTHTGEGLFSCEICSKQYRNVYLLKRHVGTTHATEENSNKVVCEECGKEFLGEYKLKDHKSTMHAKNGMQKLPPKCPTCGRQFNSASNLRSHIQRKHSGSAPKRSYKCVICNTCVREKGTLKTHLNKVHKLEGAELEEKVKQGIGKGES